MTSPFCRGSGLCCDACRTAGTHGLTSHLFAFLNGRPSTPPPCALCGCSHYLNFLWVHVTWLLYMVRAARAAPDVFCGQLPRVFLRTHVPTPASHFTVLLVVPPAPVLGWFPFPHRPYCRLPSLYPTTWPSPPPLRAAPFAADTCRPHRARAYTLTPPLLPRYRAARRYACPPADTTHPRCAEHWAPHPPPPWPAAGGAETAPHACTPPPTPTPTQPHHPGVHPTRTPYTSPACPGRLNLVDVGYRDSHVRLFLCYHELMQYRADILS